ncbi:MAG TPA: bifunctional riboflavin kinase/FAD synthetase [Anaeromyxobacteraceae bacterium]|nr:bifunctional riboflavin kinase/FAD synthetase [Anaeromyxobacteraceae bacterium]
MEVYRSLEQAGSLSGCAVVIGNLDGVHRGHRRLLETARARAAPHRARVVALTFEPHPARVLRPSMAPPILTPLARKLELLEEAGVDATVVQPFDLEYAATPAETFVRRDLRDRLGASDVVVGYDFTAGHERARVDALREMLLACGIGLSVIQPVTVDGLTVSSTKVREFLLEGNVEGAALLLGRPHDVEGVVERGAGRGRGLGFPTANLRPVGLLPAVGVYAARARVGARGRPDGAKGSPEARLYPAVCNIGVKPTVEESGPVGLEVHLLDRADGDLYGEALRVAFASRLRPERRFPSLEALREQIGKDAEQARQLLRAQGTM